MSGIKSISWLSVFSIAILLLFFGFFAMISLHSSKIADVAFHNANFIAELDQYIPDSLESEVIGYISQHDQVILESVEVIDEVQALEYMKEELPSDLTVDNNPFSKVIKFNLDQANVSARNVEVVKVDIAEQRGVAAVYSGDIAIEGLSKNVSRVSWISLMLSTVFSLLTLVLLYNGIRMTLMKDEKKIKTMQLVGAENNFILLPYLKGAMYLGLLGFVVFALIMAMALLFLPKLIPALTEFLNSGYVTLIFISVLILALSITMISTYIIISLYLRKNSNIYQ